MQQIKSYDKFTSDEFSAARELARSFYKQNDIAGKLASNIIILNVLDELLSMFLDLVHNKALLEIYKAGRNNPEKIYYINDTEPSSTKFTQTLGQKIDYLKKHFLFDSKKQLIDILLQVNKDRTQEIHKLLPSGNFKDQSKLEKLSERIFKDSNNAIETIFEIASKYRAANTKSSSNEA